MDRDVDKFASERKTLGAMIAIYCRGLHGARKALCDECDTLLTYAETRLAACCFGEHKPKCSHCAVHCYKSSMREQIRRVMRYAGPRMVVRHPILAVKHALQGRWGRVPPVRRAGSACACVGASASRHKGVRSA